MAVAAQNRSMRDPEHFCAVYILTNRKHGTLYTGVSGHLPRRLDEHRQGLASPFTRKYNVTRLVWFEAHEWVQAAREREAAIKKWRRDWKINLIERDNPNWDDLSLTFNGGGALSVEAFLRKLDKTNK